LSAGRAESRKVRLKGGGLEGLEQTVLECAPRACTARATGEAEEVLFVVAGEGELWLNGERHALEPETGVNLGPGQEYELHTGGSGPMRTAVFRPPGSPAAAYYPDGTLAYPGTPTLTT